MDGRKLERRNASAFSGAPQEKYGQLKPSESDMWFLLALCTAFLESLRDVFNKKAALAEDAYAIVWSLSFFTALFLFPLALTTGLPALGERFWWTLMADSALNAVAYVLFIKALAITELSKVAPLTTLTPLFLLITAPVMVGEFPHSMGLLGILVIVLGAYLLNLQESRQGWFDPFMGLVHEPPALD